MAELSAVPFSALPQASDGYTVLYENNQVCRSEKKLSELVGDKTSSFLTKEQGDSLYQEKGDYLVEDDITGKLDKSQYANDSATFLTAHQDISNKLDTTAFSNVSGKFLTAHQSLEGYLTKSSGDEYYQPKGNYVTDTQLEITSGEITELIPTNYYPDNNPSGFITGVDLTPYQTVAGMTAYQLTGDYATKTYVNEEIGKVGSYVTATLVNNVPDVQNPSNKKIYLTKIDGATEPDLYKEWIYTETSAWECIGDTSMDLSDYAKTDYVDELVAVNDEKIKGQVLTYNGTNNEWKSLISGQSMLPGYSPQNTNISVVKVVMGNPSEHDMDSEWNYISTQLVSDDGQNTDNINGYLLPSTGGVGIFKRWTDQRGTHQGFVTNYYTTSETSGSQQIQNALDLKEDKILFKGTNNTITSINNSAIGGGSIGGAGGAYVPLSALECTIGSGNSSISCSLAHGENNLAGRIIVHPEETVEGELISEYTEVRGYSFAQGKENSAYLFSMSQGNHNEASDFALAQGYNNVAESTSFAQGWSNTAIQYSFAQGYFNSAYNKGVCFGEQNSAVWYSFTQGEAVIAKTYSFAAGKYNYAENYSQTFGYGLKAKNYATGYGYNNAIINYGSFVIGEFNKTSAAPFVIGNGTSDNDRRDLFVVDKDGNVSAQGQIYAEGGILGASLDTLELAPDNETIEFVTSSHNVVNGGGEPEEYTVIKIKTSLLNKINELYNLVSLNSGTSNWNLPQ